MSNDNTHHPAPPKYGREEYRWDMCEKTFKTNLDLDKHHTKHKEAYEE